MAKVSTPDSEIYKDVVLNESLPKRFLYRGTAYDRDKVTKELIDRMAKDKKCHAVSVKEPVKAAPVPAKKTDDAK